MGASEPLVILQKLEDVSGYSRVALRQFPKYEKHLMGAEFRQSITQVKRLVIRASKRYFKKTTLEDIDIELEVLRSLIREAYKLKYIDSHRYKVWSENVGEVGRMIGAWLKRVKGAAANDVTKPASPDADYF